MGQSKKKAADVGNDSVRSSRSISPSLPLLSDKVRPPRPGLYVRYPVLLTELSGQYVVGQSGRPGNQLIAS